jgi:hypothetical protein
MEQGQRVAPVTTQPPAAPQPAQQQQTQPQGTTPAQVPDPIDFIGQMAGKGGVNPPSQAAPPSANLDMWVRFARRLVNGPGSSGLLAGAYINQMRQLMQNPQNISVNIIDFRDTDQAIESALDNQGA